MEEEHNQPDPGLPGDGSDKVLAYTVVGEHVDNNNMLRPTANTSAGPASTMIPVPSPACDKIVIHYEVVPAVICAVCFIVGIFYCFFGFRFFKATMFLTGFIFGGLVTYLICLEENLLPLEGKIGVALAAGVLCGLITMLVQYVGLFMTGFNLGLLLGVGTLCIMEQFYHPSTKWVCIGVLFGEGLLLALASLAFQRAGTILGTSVFGAALMVTGLDYYIELFMMVEYVWDRVRAEVSVPVCWFSWILLFLWPATCFVGALAQFKVTGKLDERKPPPQPAQTVVQAAAKKRQQKVDLEQQRQKAAAGLSRADTIHSRYRHLYQARRANGDVISQNYNRIAVVP